MTAAALKSLLNKVAAGQSLDEQEMSDALDLLLSGIATPIQMAAFIVALRVRGETVPEITGAAKFLRERMMPADAPANAIDIVGTGGDSHGTYNVSTAAAFVAAGAGVPVAKHGNRAVSSVSGAADVLQALGVKIDIPPVAVSRAIAEAGVGFLWAPMHHPAMKAWAPIRAELGIRTIFNLLGPLTNPAGVKHHVLGVFDKRWVEPIAHVLQRLGSTRAWVVHGHDGMDELTTTGPTHVAELNAGAIKVFDIAPEDAGLPRATLAQLKGGEPAQNAWAMRELLSGEPGPYRDIVVLNAGAGIYVSGRAPDLKSGVGMAADAIDSGAARQALERLAAATNRTV